MEDRNPRFRRPLVLIVLLTLFIATVIGLVATLLLWYALAAPRTQWAYPTATVPASQHAP